MTEGHKCSEFSLENDSEVIKPFFGSRNSSQPLPRYVLFVCVVCLGLHARTHSIIAAIAESLLFVRVLLCVVRPAPEFFFFGPRGPPLPAI